jgi:hypothetical protein
VLQIRENDSYGSVELEEGSNVWNQVTDSIGSDSIPTGILDPLKGMDLSFLRAISATCFFVGVVLAISFEASYSSIVL